MKRQMRQADKVNRQCVSAYLTHKPILYIVTDNMELVDYVIKEQSMVELLRWRGENLDLIKYEEIPEGQISAYLSEVNNEITEKQEKGSLKWKKNVKNFYAGANIDPLEYLDKYGKQIPVIMAVKNYNLAVQPSGATDGRRQVEANLQKYVVQYQSAPKDCAIRQSVLILASSSLLLPKGLEEYIAVIEPEPLENWEIAEIVQRFMEENNEIPERSYMDELVDRLKGFTPHQIEEVLNRTIYEAGYLTNNRYTVGRRPEELPEIVAFDLINNEKRQMLSKEGVLEYERVEQEPMIGGMEELMKYLEERCHFVLRHRMDFKKRKNIDFPKGILVCGVPGSGKSMMARKIACILNIPLIRMDMGNITKSYLGQSTEQMRKALKTAEAMAPCVLWIDEIEKAFSGVSGGGSDSASSEVMRCFGMFLTWMQEQGEQRKKGEDPTAPCFIFATANNIGTLPPEFLRSGRFDRKYYVFMPTEKECIQIFKADLESINSVTDENGNTVKLFDMAALNDGFWKSIMNYCVQDGRKKFLTGSDIHGINQEALRKLVLAEYGGDTEGYKTGGAHDRYRLLEQNFKKNKIIQNVYGRYEYGRMLKRAIDDARTYGETNLDNIAECYIGLYKNSFNPVSDKKDILIPFELYHQYQEEAIDASEEKAKELHRNSNYNQKMYCVIAEKINQLAKQLKREG